MGTLCSIIGIETSQNKKKEILINHVSWLVMSNYIYRMQYMKKLTIILYVIGFLFMFKVRMALLFKQDTVKHTKTSNCLEPLKFIQKLNNK